MNYYCCYAVSISIYFIVVEHLMIAEHISVGLLFDWRTRACTIPDNLCARTIYTDIVPTYIYGDSAQQETSMK